MASKVIISESKNHISRLIKSVQSVNLQDYETKPDGVFGIKAKIICGDVTINSDELDFEFTIPFDDDLEPNEGEVVIYNLSDKTVNQLKVDKEISIEAGYGSDTGLIFKGKITYAHTDTKSADKVTTLKIIDSISKTLESTAYEGKTASELLVFLLEKVGADIAKIESPMPRDYTFENSVTVEGDLSAEIKKYSEICGVSTFKSKGKIYCCQLANVSNGISFNISEDTGMIGSPAPFEERAENEAYEDVIRGFDIEMLLQHRAAVGALVNLKSKKHNGKYFIKSGTHRFNISEMTTSLRVVEVKGYA